MERGFRVVELPVTIQNSHGTVSIPDENIETLESVIGPVTLFLLGKALGNLGQQINRQLSKYSVGDTVQVIDYHKFEHDGIYEIVKWKLSSKGNIHEFDLRFKHK